jgi:hypothetical protein
MNKTLAAFLSIFAVILTHIAAPVNKNSKKAVNNPVFINYL